MQRSVPLWMEGLATTWQWTCKYSPFSFDIELVHPVEMVHP